MVLFVGSLYTHPIHLLLQLGQQVVDGALQPGEEAVGLHLSKAQGVLEAEGRLGCLLPELDLLGGWVGGSVRAS